MLLRQGTCAQAFECDDRRLAGAGAWRAGAGPLISGEAPVSAVVGVTTAVTPVCGAWSGCTGRPSSAQEPAPAVVCVRAAGAQVLARGVAALGYLGGAPVSSVV